MSTVLLSALLVWDTLASLVLFCLMGVDKRRAQREQWRIRERTLFLWAILGGGAGGWLGMRVFHHKTLHRRFRFGFPALTLTHAALLLWLSYFLLCH